jgi:hypothetical protein
VFLFCVNAHTQYAINWHTVDGGGGTSTGGGRPAEARWGMVTLTTHKDVRSYPCRSMESAIKLAERFIAGVIKPRPAAPLGQSGSDPSTINAQPSTAQPVAA